MKPVHGHRTYAEGTSAADQRPEPEMPAESVQCRRCEDFQTRSRHKMRLHVAGWCDEAVPMEDALELVDEWFDDEGHSDDEQLDDQDGEEDAMPDPDPQPEPEPEKTRREIVHEIVEDLAEPGEIVESGDLYDAFEERTGSTRPRSQVRKDVSYGLAKLREEGKVEDAGYGKWRRTPADAMCEGRNEPPHDVPDDDVDEDQDEDIEPEPASPRGGGEAVSDDVDAHEDDEHGIELPRTLELPSPQGEHTYLVVDADTHGFRGLASLGVFFTHDGGSIGRVDSLRPEDLDGLIATLEEAKRQVEACDEEGGIS